MTETVRAEVIGELRGALASMKKNVTFTKMDESKDEVLARFHPVFSADHVPDITEEEFRSFLLDKNNHHWTGLHRQGPRMCRDMAKLRRALATLLRETEPVSKRLDEATKLVSGMGRAVASAILLVTKPEQYGVWNKCSNDSMIQLGILPKFEQGESLGNQYVKVNQVLLQLRDALATDLWTLDLLWWFLDEQKPPEIRTVERTQSAAPDVLIERAPGFVLERHLHEFLRDNWGHLELGREWGIYREPGEEEAGYEYACVVGRIDLLARHKTEPRWLVVELKRNQTSDQTVGQLLRYIGWVKRHLAKAGDEVHGMIICREADDALRYALSVVSNVELRLYEVEFHLRKPEAILAMAGGAAPI